MSKKVALLVTSTLRTRVVVDAPDDWDENTNEELWFGEGDTSINEQMANEIATQAAEHYRNCINCGIYDNIEEVVNDIEIPYGQGYLEDKGL